MVSLCSTPGLYRGKWCAANSNCYIYLKVLRKDNAFQSMYNTLLTVKLYVLLQKTRARQNNDSWLMSLRCSPTCPWSLTHRLMALFIKPFITLFVFVQPTIQYQSVLLKQAITRSHQYQTLCSGCNGLL